MSLAGLLVSATVTISLSFRSEAFFISIRYRSIQSFMNVAARLIGSCSRLLCMFQLSAGSVCQTLLLSAGPSQLCVHLSGTICRTV